MLLNNKNEDVLNGFITSHPMGVSTSVNQKLREAEFKGKNKKKGF